MSTALSHHPNADVGAIWIDRLPHVHGIEPVEGWHLLVLQDASGWLAPREFAAAKAGWGVVHLGVSRWAFDPTQDRFAWLVRNGFPGQAMRPSGVRTPLTNADIDAAIAAEAVAA